VTGFGSGKTTGAGWPLSPAAATPGWVVELFGRASESEGGLKPGGAAAEREAGRGSDFPHSSQNCAPSQFSERQLSQVIITGRLSGRPRRARAAHAGLAPRFVTIKESEGC
jgi:hypothetical protein